MPVPSAWHRALRISSATLLGIASEGGFHGAITKDKSDTEAAITRQEVNDVAR